MTSVNAFHRLLSRAAITKSTLSLFIMKSVILVALLCITACTTQEQTELTINSQSIPTTRPGDFKPSITPSVIATSSSFTPTPIPTTNTTETRVYDLVRLQNLMLDLINADREANSLSFVQWDGFAAQMAQAHAEEMVALGYMSHWNLDGEGPDIRYGRAGGTEFVQENVYMYWFRYDNGQPAPIEDWDAVISEAQSSLMNSPGHRANILTSEHTHVGIGIAYNAETGDVRMAQEFINRYILLESIPQQAHIGDTLMIAGHLLFNVSEPLINLAYEPFPQAMTVSEVESMNTYQSPAEIFLAITPDMHTDSSFSASVTLDFQGQEGIYHIRIWGDIASTTVQAADVIVDVTE